MIAGAIATIARNEIVSVNGAAFVTGKRLAHKEAGKVRNVDRWNASEHFVIFLLRHFGRNLFRIEGGESHAAIVPASANIFHRRSGDDFAIAGRFAVLSEMLFQRGHILPALSVAATP